MKKQVSIGLGVLVVFMLLMSFYIVKEGQVAIKLRLGQVVEKNIEPGLHFKIPGVETLNERCIRWRLSSTDSLCI